ncbi:CFF_HP2_G0035070.mRNA.1.CDS.1 [Saccharomyces cerevisiae]|nr:CFF_HP2_G0035070.mRNA.1.CDS.1 [Saccharomyces cerevisiae]CAI6566691.1 CFF_HP2_G0035070.mRNA.1.CDS.1 [Saccharomyces cerevisiae]CAI6574822.1 CFF_HP1_G0036890.mRNA.1.CDS.1 [Saccharomyces cerevisiae]
MSRKLKKTNLFNKDVSSLLYAYGDVPQPLQATVQCLDELVSGYLVDVCTNASHTAQNSQRNKLRLEDFKFALRKDPIKLGRAEELIATNKLITEAKKQFNETDNQNSLKRYREEDEEGDEMEEDEDEQQVTDDDEEGVGRNSAKQSTDSKATKIRKQAPKNLKKTKK